MRFQCLELLPLESTTTSLLLSSRLYRARCRLLDFSAKICPQCEVLNVKMASLSLRLLIVGLRIWLVCYDILSLYCLNFDGRPQLDRRLNVILGERYW